MKMIRQLMGCIREYKKPTILTLLCMVGEVAIEVLIPFFTANLINEVKAGAELGGIVRVGLVLILMALVSLSCGAAAVCISGAGPTILCLHAQADFAARMTQAVSALHHNWRVLPLRVAPQGARVLEEGAL